MSYSSSFTFTQSLDVKLTIHDSLKVLIEGIETIFGMARHIST